MSWSCLGTSVLVTSLGAYHCHYIELVELVYVNQHSLWETK